MVSAAPIPVTTPPHAARPAAPRTVAGGWQRLATVLDPEVPVMSIVELGIVRALALDAHGWHVTITPTYSGCPALAAIVEDIRAALSAPGVPVGVTTTLAPAWSTDWIAPEARHRLRGFGIVPPPMIAASRGVEAQPIDVAGISPLRRKATAVRCPRCGSVHTALLAQFGSTACKALYRCEQCAEPFDYLKPH